MLASRLSVIVRVLVLAVAGSPTLVRTAALAGDAAEEFRFFRSDRGVAAAEAGPLPDDLDRPESPCWRIELDPGHSSPILSRGRLFLTTYREQGRELATVALDARTGGVRWRRVLPAARIEDFHRQSGGPAQATPACDGERVFAFFGSHGLVALDLEGRPLWEHRMGPFQDEYGAGSSPILVEDKVIVQQDHDGGIVTKLDASTGTLLQEERLPAVGSYYASPVAGDGKVYFASEAGVVSVLANARDWRIISSHDFKERIQATPLIHGGRIYIRTARALYCFAGR